MQPIEREDNMEVEKFWRRDCKICTHAYYIPYKEPGKYLKLFRKIFKTKKKFRDCCPVCNSPRVLTTKLVTREIKQTVPTK